jgi:hypothetical protein
MESWKKRDYIISSGEMSGILQAHQRQLDRLNKFKIYLLSLVRTGIEETRSPLEDSGPQFTQWIKPKTEKVRSSENR